MTIKQEEIMGVIETALAWENCVNQVKSALVLTSEAYPDARGIVSELLHIINSTSPSGQSLGRIYYWQKYYKGRAQTNLMRRATNAAIKADASVARDYEAVKRASRGVRSTEKELKGYQKPEVAQALAEPPPPYEPSISIARTPPHPPGSVTLTTNAPPDTINPFDGLSDPRSEGETEALRKLGVKLEGEGEA